MPILKDPLVTFAACVSSTLFQAFKRTPIAEIVGQVPSSDVPNFVEDHLNRPIANPDDDDVAAVEAGL